MEFTVFAYALLASFVVSSVKRNAQEARRGPKVLTLAAWGLMSFSAALFVLLAGLVVAVSLGVTTIG
jgi:Na+/H+ antiporter NhaD/arsenite permease-like protein